MLNKICKYFSFFSLTVLLTFSATAKSTKTLSATDGTGRVITLEEVPQSIISLGAASTEILYEVGAESQIAAVSSYSDYPEAAKSLPVVGGFDANSISVEAIVGYSPDLVILYKGMHEMFVPTLDELGIPYYMSDVKDINGVIQEISAIATLTGHEDKVSSLEKKYKKALSSIKVKKGKQVSVYYEVWYGPTMTCGGESFINGIIEAAGAKNIFGDVKEAYPMVSDEALIAMNPDYIIIPAGNLAYSSLEDVANRPGWENLDAVKNGKIIVVDDNLYSRAGPRVFEAIEDLYKNLYTK